MPRSERTVHRLKDRFRKAEGNVASSERLTKPMRQ